jgi:rsbT co-antagonist protein RsbR
VTTRTALAAFVNDVLPTLRAIEGGDLGLRVRVPGPITDPLGALVAGANALVENLAQARERIRSYQRELEQQITLIEKQRAAIRELSTPIIEVWTGVLCIPIVGVLDAERASEMTNALLGAVAERKAPLTIIDVTGIENMDTAASDHFLRMARAVRLLGAECVISGINPNVAWTITQLQVDLGGIRTHRTLREALQHHVRKRTPRKNGGQP